MRQWLEGVEARKGLDRLTDGSRRLVLGSYGLLLALMVYRGVIVTTDGNPLVPLLAFVLPLVLFLPSILTRRPRGHAWLAFVSLLYFTQGVMVATLPGQGLRGGAEALVALALFVGCTAYARFRSRQQRAD
ncbi:MULTISPECIES: DUF2069 domain-containing protein [Halomonas]|uniref:Putative membrane protein n=1 Tax=Halomonas ventosae TaxID=229007 RepID=A0A4R6ZXS1_9GAMM|nr:MULTISPECIES: DUF2069 domain-containing protein [Halomonas]MDW7745121.1 DUF2069 domain-containing protein [Halomonas sp.]TDR57402.1 putative membrane protein [Halomonas ventosae]WFM69695.1 DUF2069 domain-containing protein [Halomonas sp. CKK8]